MMMFWRWRIEVGAWEILSTKRSIDILITDWNMSEMNGLELVKKTRVDAHYEGIPVIMVTTEGGKTETITALKAGVNNCIIKPFTPQVLKKSSKLFLESDD